jgi:hypothetical protein
MTVENYWIDKKLKSRRDYPPELITLTAYISKRWKLSDPGDRRGRQQQQKELGQIERIFNEYFFCQSKVKEFDKKHRDLIEVYASLIPWEPHTVKRGKDYWQAFLEENGEDPRRIINRCIQKVNAKLKETSPQLSEKGGRYYLDPAAIRFDRRCLERNRGGIIEQWILLAKVIDRVDPPLYKRCAHCQQVFFSRQRKKYHTECRSKYFSEKAVKTGLARKRQKAYRERLKKRSATR